MLYVGLLKSMTLMLVGLLQELMVVALDEVLVAPSVSLSVWTLDWVSPWAVA